MHKSIICSMIASDKRIQRRTFESSTSVAERMSLNIKDAEGMARRACKSETTSLRFNVRDVPSHILTCATTAVPS